MARESHGSAFCGLFVLLASAGIGIGIVPPVGAATDEGYGQRATSNGECEFTLHDLVSKATYQCWGPLAPPPPPPPPPSSPASATARSPAPAPYRLQVRMRCFSRVARDRFSYTIHSIKFGRTVLGAPSDTILYESAILEAQSRGEIKQFDERHVLEIADPQNRHLIITVRNRNAVLPADVQCTFHVINYGIHSCLRLAAVTDAMRFLVL